MQCFQASNSQEAEPRYNSHNNTLTLEDMVMWLVSDKDFDLDKVIIRLKNLVFYRALENPHKEVNAAQIIWWYNLLVCCVIAVLDMF